MWQENIIRNAYACSEVQPLHALRVHVLNDLDIDHVDKCT